MSIVLLGILMLATAQGVPAPPAEPQAFRPSAPWQVDFSERNCTLSRRYKRGDVEAILAIGYAPLSETANLQVATPALEQSPPARPMVSARLQPDNIEENAPGYLSTLTNELQKISEVALPYDFVRKLAGARILRIQVGTDAPLPFMLTAASPALDVLEKCNDDLLTKWGIDPAPLKLLMAMPISLDDPRSWVTREDYPMASLAPGVSGTVSIKFMVQVDGHVRHCAVTVTSGDPKLDALTCALVTRRALYRPATGADQKPVAAPMAVTVAWPTPGQ